MKKHIIKKNVCNNFKLCKKQNFLKLQSIDKMAIDI